ncbi:MAG: porin [Rhodospirillaceae bacterium]
MKRLGLVIGVASALLSSSAFGAELTPGTDAPPPPKSELSVSSNNSLRIGYQSPVAGAFSLGAPVVGRRPIGGLGVANAQDVSARFSTHLFGGDVGVFGGYADRPSTLSLSPVSSWNFGATVGYAGVYVLGGVSDSAAFGPFLGREGWAAGLGYDMGAVDLRLTYAAEGSDLASMGRAADTQQITLGGIYSISPRFSLNAETFYSGRERGLLYLTAPNAKTPQGTGARVGIQLRF